MRLGLRALAAVAVLAALPSAAMAQPAGDIVFLTGMGPESGVRQIAAGFEKATGHKVVVSFETGPSLEKKFETNAPADLFAGGPEQIADLIKTGRIVAGTDTKLGLAGLGLSVKAGTPKPDISTVEKYKALMLSAKSIGYSRGCSGAHTAAGMAKLGIADQVKAKTVLTGGGPVAEYLAKGDFEIGIQQTNVLLGVAGTDYVGPLPGDLDDPCPFHAGLLKTAKQEVLALALLKYMATPEAAEWLRKGNMDPFPR